MLKLIFFLPLLGIVLSSPACPTGSFTLPSAINSTWPCASINNVGVTFFAAEKACQQQAGHLISISNTFVNSMLAALTSAIDTNAKYWIGVTNLFGKVWLNIDSGARTTYFDWASQQPPNNPDADGVLIDSQGNWYVSYGSNTNYYICGVPEVGSKKE